SGAMASLQSQTAVTRVYHSSCRAGTDVRWTQGPIPNAYGEARCVLRNANDYCDRYLLTLNDNIINQSEFPAAQRRKTACHEVGHTGGVRHYSNSDFPGNDTAHSCLRSGAVPAASQAWHTRYGAHHRTAHINPWFS